MDMALIKGNTGFCMAVIQSREAIFGKSMEMRSTCIFESARLCSR